MDAMTENSIRQEQVESIGRLMAGFAHDMKNHLGIIRESNGLMDDIIAMGTLGEDERSVERLKKSIAAIERRVVVAAKMFHHLSGLAHRPDTPYSSFLINDLIEEEYIFLERFSRLKQINVVFDFAEGLAAVYSDPSLLQHIIYRVYSQCLELLENDQTLTIITAQDENNVVITFRFPKKPQLAFDTIFNKILHDAIDKLEGKLEIGDGEKDTVDIRLVVSSLSVETMQ